jgi:hypothetical protein
VDVDVVIQNGVVVTPKGVNVVPNAGDVPVHGTKENEEFNVEVEEVEEEEEDHHSDKDKSSTDTVIGCGLQCRPTFLGIPLPLPISEHVVGRGSVERDESYRKVNRYEHPRCRF